MTLTDTLWSYGAVSRLNHWAGAALIIGLLAFRVLWRVFARSPQSLARSARLQTASRYAHAALLALIAVLIVSGPLTVWSGGRPIDVFGLFALASPMGKLPQLHEALETVHVIASRLLLGLLVLHVAAALWHAVFDRRAVPAA